jgi:uncharacterized beta-barrel protein YwiB (DUF1934 family)
LTKDVLVSIQGLQFASGDVQEESTDEELDQIETICPGEYFYRNNAHFVLYEEILDDMSEPVKNMIKVRNSEFVLTKKGPLNVQMVFSEGKKTMTDYVTPFGNIMIALDTKKIDIQEKENIIIIHINYGLEANYQFIADCDISMEIKSRA